MRAAPAAAACAGIKPEYLGRINVASSLASIFGIWLYRNYLAEVPIKAVPAGAQGGRSGRPYG